jgi:GDP-4-dehydro-6-deoxy-D-mannose reductase
MNQNTNSSPTILITGGTGFAGSHLVDALLEQGQTNVHVTSYGKNTGYVAEILPESQLHSLDITDFEATKELISQIQPDHIYHLAALAGVGSSFTKLKQVLDINTQIQLSVLIAMQEVRPQARLLSIGSALEYQPQDRPLRETDPLGPISPYGVSKVTQDMLAYAYYKQNNLQIIRTRSFNHIGERQAPGFVVADFAQQIVKIESGEQLDLQVGNLSAIRDFTDVKDMVKAYILLMNQGEIGEVYNIGSGQGYTIAQILDILVSQSKAEISVIQDETKIRPTDISQVVADNSKIKQLGWTPVISIQETLARTLNYYRTKKD